MSHILFVVEKPTSSTAVKIQWESFATGAKRISEGSEGTLQLGEGVWLIPVQNALRVLSELHTSANALGFPCRAFLINGEVTEMNTEHSSEHR